jgi:hypothetical protein
MLFLARPIPNGNRRVAGIKINANSAQIRSVLHCGWVDFIIKADTIKINGNFLRQRSLFRRT